MKNLPLLVLLFSVLPSVFFAQDPDIEARERSVLEELFRTSDVDASKSTSPRVREGGRKRVSAPAGAKRIGCVCMDDSRSGSHSSGACSGRGGVRYWLYRTVEGDTTKVLTARHEQHPHPLDSLERSEINVPKVKLPRGTAAAAIPMIQPVIIQPSIMPAAPYSNDLAGGNDWFDWSDAATITGGGMSIYFTLRLLLRWIDSHQTLVRYALRHLLRFGKRPPPRKSRKDPAPPRV